MAAQKAPRKPEPEFQVALDPRYIPFIVQECGMPFVGGATDLDKLASDLKEEEFAFAWTFHPSMVNAGRIRRMLTGS